MRILSAGLILFACVFLIGAVCETIPTSEKITFEETYGVWTGDFNSGLLDQITIFPDGRYVHDFISFDSTHFSDTANYSLRYHTEYGVIDSTCIFIALSHFRRRFPHRPNGPPTEPYFGRNALLDSTSRGVVTRFHKLNGRLRLLNNSYYAPGYSKH